MTQQPEIKANPGKSQTSCMQPIPLPKNAQRHCSTKECDLPLSPTLSASAVHAQTNTNGVDVDDWVESENPEEKYPKARSSQSGRDLQREDGLSVSEQPEEPSRLLARDRRANRVHTQSTLRPGRHSRSWETNDAVKLPARCCCHTTFPEERRRPLVTRYLRHDGKRAPGGRAKRDSLVDIGAHDSRVSPRMKMIGRLTVRAIEGAFVRCRRWWWIARSDAAQAGHTCQGPLER